MHCFRLARLRLPHAGHFQLDGSGGADAASGGLVSGSTDFGLGRLGTNDGQAPGEDFDAGGEGWWKDWGV